MEIRELALMSEQSLEQLLRGIPFYKELQQKDPEQFAAVIGVSKLVELEPGETIMRRGEKGSWLYFLVKGRLVVLGDDQHAETPLNVISPGELFGDLAMFSNCERSATVRADTAGKKVLLLATNFARFGKLDDFQRISLATKLMLYRMVVHGIRWKLELNRMEDTQNPLIKDLMRLPLFSGVKNSVDELHFLSQQAKQLSQLLTTWNAQKQQPKSLFVAPAQTELPAADQQLA